MSLENAWQLSVFDVSCDSNADFRDEDDQKEHRESQNHPAGLTQGSATAEEGNDENHGSDDHKNDRRRPESFADKVLIMMIRILNYSADDDGEESGQLAREKGEKIRSNLRTNLNKKTAIYYE